MTEQPQQSAVKTEQLHVPSVVKTESEFCVWTQRVCTLHTHVWRTAKLSDQTHKHWIHLRKPQHRTTTLTTKPIPHTLEWTVFQQQLPTFFSLHFFNPCAYYYSILGWATGHLSIFVPTTCTTLGLTYAHNQMNRVSGMDSKSFWGAYPGVVSDTPTECVTQCANVPSLKRTPDTTQTMH